MPTEKKLEIDNLSTIDYIRQMDSSRDQDSTAVEYYGNTISRKQYWSYIEQYRKYFKGIGIKKGEPVTVCMVNSPEYEFVFAALLENGSIASTVSKSFINADFKRQTTERKIKTLILSVEFAAELANFNTFAQLGNNDSADRLERVIFTTAGDYMPEEQAVKYNNQDFTTIINALNIPKNIEVIMPGKIRKSLSRYSRLGLENENLLDEIATYSNTGGTTGAPKCACHTHRAIISLLKSHERDVFPEFDMKEQARSLLVIPISHITSQFYGLLMRRTHGATIVYNPNCFEPAVLRDVLIKEKIDDVVLPFGLYYAITRQEFKTGELKLNTPLCGGEPTPYTPTKDVDEKLRKAGSNPIIIGTGSTEFGSGIMASYGEDSRCNESGYFFPYAKGFLFDPKTCNKITEPGKRGILYANAPWQMEGYLNDDKATAEFFNYTDDDGTVYGTNNDIAEITGYHNGQPIYSMLGRATDFIKTDDGETYYSGSTFKNGMIESVDFEDGSFLFDMRDVLLNVPGVMEAQPIIIPQYKGAKNGYPVVNITIYPGAEPKNILKQVYEHYSNSNDVAPVGIIFRTHFARSLSSDKREVLSLIDERKGYFCVNKNGALCSVEFSDNGEKIVKTLEQNAIIERVNPPEPKLVFSSRKNNNT